MYGAPGPGSYDDALVLDEELSSIETWRRGITPSEEGGEGEEGELESVDLELITPEAARSVRGDAQSIRTTTRTHRSSKSHRSHRSAHGSSGGGSGSSSTSRRHHHSHSHSHSHSHHHGEEDEEDRTTVVMDVPVRTSSSSSRSPLAARAESVAATTERSHRTARSKAMTTASVRTREVRAIEDGSRAEENTLDAVLRGSSSSSSIGTSSKDKDKKPNMLKTLFKKKKDREDAAVSVMA